MRRSIGGFARTLAATFAGLTALAGAFLAPFPLLIVDAECGSNMVGQGAVASKGASSK